VCHKGYDNKQLEYKQIKYDAIIEDSHLGSACSFFCNTDIVTKYAINDNTKDSLKSIFDFNNQTAEFFQNPLDKTLNITTNLKKQYIFENDTMYAGVCGILLHNGDISSADAYYNYQRLKKVEIEINGENLGFAYLYDTPKVQYIHFGKCEQLEVTSKLSIKLTFKTFYESKKYNALALSELQLDGYGGHSLTIRRCWLKENE